ncbi:6905_t:CDS:2 [Diversispora eburnea]|uniref:6905_t:CDS:1 n=1 Tax=Diversispora eburnea TaxID=1213867 RepID=A0A9N9AL59_9GLOM|nr:6905_t:CDS:2 [Diversispora eburnea]
MSIVKENLAKKLISNPYDSNDYGLDELVHELDFSVKLSKGDGLMPIISLLNHDSNEIKKKAALVIGTAMQRCDEDRDGISRLAILY